MHRTVKYCSRQEKFLNNVQKVFKRGRGKQKYWVKTACQLVPNTKSLLFWLQRGCVKLRSYEFKYIKQRLKKCMLKKNIQEDEQAKGFKLKLHLDQLSLPRKALAMHWHVRTTSSSVHWGRKEKYGCAAKPTMFVPGWRLCKQNTYLSNAVYGSDIWNFSGLTLGLFSHNRICPRMHPSCPPLPRHLPPCIRSSPLCNVHTAFIPRTQDQDPDFKSTWQIHCSLYPFYLLGVSFS